MVLRRYCGHLKDVEEPENGEKFLMERGRYCRKCKNVFRTVRKTGRNNVHELPRPMAMAMDTYRE